MDVKLLPHIWKKRYNNFIIIWLWLDLKFRSFSFTHSFIHCLKFVYIKNQQHVFRLKFHFINIWCECIFCLFDLWWSSYLCVCVVTFDIVDQDHHQCIHFCLQIISCFTWLNLLLLLLKKKYFKIHLVHSFHSHSLFDQIFRILVFFHAKKTDKIQYRTIDLSMWEKNLLIIIIVVDDDDDGFILRPFSTIYNE